MDIGHLFRVSYQTTLALKLIDENCVLQGRSVEKYWKCKPADKSHETLQGINPQTIERFLR